VDAVDTDTALGAVLAARWAQAAAMAVEAAALCRLVAAYPECGLRGRDPARTGVEFELMAALGVSHRSAANRVAFGLSLGELPELAGALRTGVLDVPTGLMILDKVGVLADPGLRREVVARVLAGHAATGGGLTRAQLARLVGRAVAAVDPTGAARRQAQARRDRYVAHQRPPAAGEAGQLVAVKPAERVAICAETIEAIARAWAREGSAPGAGPGARRCSASGARPAGCAGVGVGCVRWWRRT
jgi:hypothetical protein